MVARTRGGRFVVSGKNITPAENGLDIAREALRDVARWLGFHDSDGYVTTLGKEGRAIFKRAKRTSR